MAKCNLCGIKSEFEAAFIKPSSLIRQRKAYCPTCWDKKTRSGQTKLLVGYLGLGLCGWALMRIDSDSLIGHVLFYGFLLQLFLIVTILPHELGHAAAARLLGWRVFSVMVGIGKTLFKKSVGGVLFE